MSTCCIPGLIVVSYQIATCLVASISAYFSTKVTLSYPHSTAAALDSYGMEVLSCQAGFDTFESETMD